MRFLTKWLALALPVLLLAAWSVGPASAEQKITMKGKAIKVIVEQKSYKIGDVDGHMMGMVHAQGVDVVQKATVYSWSVADTVKFNGPFRGWNKLVFPNGDTLYHSFKGKLIPKRSPDGKPMLVMQGTYKIAKGTGKWAGAQGGGTFKGIYLSMSIYTYDWEGQYTLKK